MTPAPRYHHVRVAHEAQGADTAVMPSRTPTPPSVPPHADSAAWTTFRMHATRVQGVVGHDDGTYTKITRGFHRTVRYDPLNGFAVLEVTDLETGLEASGYLPLSPWMWIRALCGDDVPEV